MENVLFPPTVALGATPQIGFAIWDLHSGRLLQTIVNNYEFRPRIAFSPDSKRFAAPASDRTVGIWDANTYEQRLSVRGTDPRLLAYEFSRDGKQLRTLWGDNTIRILQSDSAYPPEAQQLVADLFAKYVSAADVIAHIKADRTLDAYLRGKAEMLARVHGDDADELNRRSWRVVVSPDAKPVDYRMALRRAELAAQLMPWQSGIINTLGVAQYRTGRFEEALKNFELSDRLSNRDRPANAIFSAMAYFRLGQVDRAVKAFEKLRRFQQEQRWSIDRELRAYYLEAETLIKQRR